MKLHPTILAGLFSCLVLTVIYTYMIVSRVTVMVPVDGIGQATVGATILNSTVFQDLAKKNPNGPLPVSIQAGEIGNQNPFE